MKTFMRFRCWTIAVKFYDVKQTRKLSSGVKQEKSKIFSQIPNTTVLLEKFFALKKAEKHYKMNLLNEFISECSMDYFLCNESKIKKMSTIKVPIKELQVYNYFSTASSITDKLLSYLEPFSFDSSQIQDKEKNGEISVYFIKNEIEKQYLAWKYKVDVTEISNIYKRLKNCIHKFNSLRNLRECVTFLETVPGIEKQSVAEKIYHLNQKPFDVDNIINFQEKIAGVTWHVFPHYCPKILKSSHQFILLSVFVLEVLNFSERQIKLGLPFLHFSFVNFLSKLNNLLENPNLKNYRNQPEFLQLLKFKSDKLSYLSESRSYQELIQSINLFTDNSRNMFLHKKGIRYLISLFYKIDNEVIQKLPIRHFKFISETQIYETLTYLKNHGFTSKEIEEALPVIFYPSYLIARTLDNIKNEEENLKKIGYSDGCIHENYYFIKGTKEKRKLLQLCLYYMQKPFDFSEDAVWYILGSNSEY